MGNTSCIDLVNAFFLNIQEKNDLNAFIEVFEESAVKQAIEVDKKIAAGSAGKLAGMVISLKDLLCFKDHKVTGGSHILNDFTSLYSATVVEKLLKEDAIIIGRTNCDEFGMGSSNENSFYGPVKNAANVAMVPGGSSGGAAVSVQAEGCHVAIGTDTGGSVRQPAAFCGLYGLKPTYSRISRFGLLSYASSFDTIGVLSKTLEDNALVFQILAGHDEKDSTSSSLPVNEVDFKPTKNKYKIAYFDSALNEGVDKSIRDTLQKNIDNLRAEGNTVEEIRFPLAEYILPVYYILTTAEASSNLERYDGVRYGYRDKNVTDLENLYKLSRSHGFGDEVKRRIFLGTFVLSANYYDAYYIKAQKARRLIRDTTRSIFKEYDFILGPVSSTNAFPLESKSEDPLAMYLSDLYTVQASVAGIPAISLPQGNDKNGLPIGIQVMADDFKEAELYAFSNYLQKLGCI